MRRQQQGRPPPRQPRDRAHPLAQGLVFAVPLLAGGGVPYDLVRDQPGAFLGNATGAFNQYPAIALDGAGDGVTFGARDFLGGPASHATFSILARPTATATVQSLINKDDTNTAGGWSVVLATTNLGLWNGSTFDEVAAAPEVGVWQRFTIVFRAGVNAYYRDAALLGTITTTTTALTDDPGALALGIRAGPLDEAFAGQLAAAYIWRRALSRAEIVALVAAPFAPVAAVAPERRVGRVTPRQFARPVADVAAGGWTVGP